MASMDRVSNEQTDKILQFQDLTGIEDMNVCRDILTRHHWDLEVAIHEQMNIREGRPSMYATSVELRAPPVVNDRFLQQVFTTNMPGGRVHKGPPMPSNFGGIFRYVINFVFQYCYSTLSTIISTFFTLVRSNERILSDPLGDVMAFIQTYNEKYPHHPVFYQGTYAQALSDAKQELRFLLVYLHKELPKNPDVQTFCANTLSDQSVIDYVNHNVLFWGCDVASPQGYRVAHSIHVRTYPILVLIGLRAHKMVIMGRFEGDCTPDWLVKRLQTVISSNEVWLSQERTDRLERSFNQSLRQQQDEAYEQSLRADEEKERRRQEQLDRARKAEEAAENEIKAKERRKEEIANQKIELAQRVPSEPPPTAPNCICVVFKLPNGTRIERRFLSSDSLQDVYNYLFCHPSSPDEFEITTNFPKRLLYAKDRSEGLMSLQDVGLKNREVLFVNDLDA